MKSSAPLVSSPTYDIVTEDVIGSGDSPALARKRSGMGLRLEAAICRHAEEGCGV